PDRFRSCIIQQETYLFTCQKYIEMNPVRAEMVQQPGEYRWSSYSRNACGEKSDVIKPHFLYQELGETRKERQDAYQALFRHELNTAEIDGIRKNTNGGFSLGDNRFHTEISQMLGRRVVSGKAGRPKKKQEK
ncbi:MAG: transposase, partial [Candidatus Electrothrix sp. ATG2]|nr:transposase [Candidatus Electrothrix sp. ATG2]